MPHWFLNYWKESSDMKTRWLLPYKIVAEILLSHITKNVAHSLRGLADENLS
jgi:hypothetical protein